MNRLFGTSKKEAPKQEPPKKEEPKKEEEKPQVSLSDHSKKVRKLCIECQFNSFSTAGGQNTRNERNNRWA